MKMTVDQFEIIKNLDDHGQLDLVDSEIREEYLGALRYCEIRSAGIEVKNESTSNNPSNFLSDQTRAWGLLAADRLDAKEDPKEELVRPLATPQPHARMFIPSDHISSEQAIRVVLASTPGRVHPFLRRQGKK